MRRKDREVTEFGAMMEIVKDCGCCRLGMVLDGGAYIVPVNFGYEVKDGALLLYFHGAAEGQKVSLLRQNPAASFEMDTGHRLVPGPKADDHTYAYRSVMGRGVVTFLEEDGAKLHALNRIMDHYTHRDDWTVEAPMLHATAVYCMRVTDWTAKVHLVP